ncbi:hypothetical protein, partial [Actinomadura sp. HBU206391]|uniref:hypothetical protein n=1 Tax=Actinomadura sp. HBU206391 TaxID=2731692 RepID=UPI00164FA32F
RERYREQWTQIQEKFVDDPEAVVGQADRLVTTVAAERGYPTGSFDEQITTLSVDHGHTVDHYRRAHEIGDRAGRKEASTEDLRQAMVHYRALFEDLLGTPSGERDRQADGPQAEEKRLEDRPVEDEQVKDRQVEDRRVNDEQVNDKRAREKRADDKSADTEQVDETRVEDRPAENKRTEDKNRKSDSTGTEE